MPQLRVSQLKKSSTKKATEPLRKSAAKDEIFEGSEDIQPSHRSDYCVDVDDVKMNHPHAIPQGNISRNHNFEMLKSPSPVKVTNKRT